MKIAKQKYRDHRGNARKRGVEFKLTFDEWYQIWISSGFWELRGPNKGQYCMSRFGDKGAYESTNVFIQLNGKNTQDAHLGVSKGMPTLEHKQKISVSMTGIKRSDETKQRMSDGWKNRSIKVCPHCGMQTKILQKKHIIKCKEKI